MKKIIAFILLCQLINYSFSQNLSLSQFEAGGNYVIAKTSTLGQGSNTGAGLFIGCVKEISKKSELIQTSRLGASHSS
jgi:hypothetical protein